MSTGGKPEGATTIFVLGLRGLVICAPLGIFAWIQGNAYLANCRRAGVEPEGLGVAGRVMGMIASILMGAGVVLWLLVMCLALGAGVAGN